MANKNHKSSVYYDKKDKKWKCAYYIKDKRKYKSFYSEEEANAFATSIELQKENELFIKNNGIPLNQLMRANAQKKLDMNVIREVTYTRIIETIQIIEKYPVATKNIDEITSNEIQDCLNSLIDNYSNSTIQKIKTLFSQTFNKSKDKGYIIKNPMIDIIKPKSNKDTKIVRALEIEEQQKLTDYLMSVPVDIEPYKNVFLIQMYMGLRVGEALALKNTDIDLANNLIRVNKTLTKDKKYNIIMGDTTKTYSGMREIPITLSIKESIIEQMKLAENHKEKLLFVDKNGDYARHANVNRDLKEILKILGITGITTHSLRHTYGTRCVALQRLMGHKDVSVTLNTYTSVFNKYKESELEKVNQYYMNNNLFNQVDNPALLAKNTELDEDYER